jgi:molybdenum cofactor biosynthesis protein B
MADARTSPRRPTRSLPRRAPAACLIHNLLMSHIEHKQASPAVAHCFILTVSDTRTEATDSSGRAICDLLWAEGHQVDGRRIVRDEPDLVRAAITEQLASTSVQVILTTGGTGITSRDTTYEAISGLLEKRLDGFGELFRMISYHDIGSAAMLSRAVGGLAKGKVILALPGSEAAVRLAMTKLVLPELGHLVREASR